MKNENGPHCKMINVIIRTNPHYDRKCLQTYASPWNPRVARELTSSNRIIFLESEKQQLILCASMLNMLRALTASDYVLQNFQDSSFQSTFEYAWFVCSQFCCGTSWHHKCCRVIDCEKLRISTRYCTLINYHAWYRDTNNTHYKYYFK